MTQRLPEVVLHKGRLSPASAASKNRLIDSKRAKHVVGFGADSLQVNAPAALTPVPVRVVIRKALKPSLAILRLRLGLLGLQAKVGVLALQRPDPLSQKGQVLAEHRRRATLIDQRLQLLQQRLKHLVLLGLSGRLNGTEGGAA